MESVNVYEYIAFYWTCPKCGQEHDWPDAGQFGPLGVAVYMCTSCMTDFRLVLRSGH